MVLCLLPHVERDDRLKDRALVGNSGVGTMDSREHIPFSLIKDFAYGDVSLDELQLHHLRNCEECSEICEAFKREAHVIKRAKALHAKTQQDITRLLQENSPDCDKK